MSIPDPDRRNIILAAALGVFGRFGYRKASVNEIAAAAGISKPGLYMYFDSKEEIFAAALEKYLADRLDAVDAILSRRNRPLAGRVQAAIEAWFGEHLKIFAPGSYDVIPEGDRLSEAQVEASKQAFRAKLACALNELGIGHDAAADRAQVIFLCGLSWKQPGTTPQSFARQMKACVRVCCAPPAPDTKAI